MMDLFGGDSSVAEPVATRDRDGGSIPTSSLHIVECNVSRIQGVIERVHYSHSIFGVTVSHCYAVEVRGRVVGGAIFGLPGAYNVSRKYDCGEPLLELRRFVLEDFLPRNSESRSLAVMFRDLRRKGIKRILSYADPAFGHSGVIYAATGFKRIGLTSSRKHIMWKGKKYPDRNVHQVNFPFHKEIRAALASGEAVKINVPGKVIWLKNL
jgi:hypothetical protein